MNIPKNCPKCGVTLEEGDVFETFLEMYPDDPKKALEMAGYYGWKKENPCCFSRCIGIYDEKEDRTMGWQCRDCSHTWSRFA